jgi:hypothetical protein
MGLHLFRVQGYLLLVILCLLLVVYILILVIPSSPIQLASIDKRSIGSTNSGVDAVSNPNATIAGQIVPYTRDSRTLDFVYKKIVHI